MWGTLKQIGNNVSLFLVCRKPQTTHQHELHVHHRCLHGCPPLRRLHGQPGPGPRVVRCRAWRSRRTRGWTRIGLFGNGQFRPSLLRHLRRPLLNKINNLITFMFFLQNTKIWYILNKKIAFLTQQMKIFFFLLFDINLVFLC